MESSPPATLRCARAYPVMLREGLGAESLIDGVGNRQYIERTNIAKRSMTLSLSELEPRLEGDHPRRAVAAQSDAQQARGRRGGVRQRAETRLRRRSARNPREREHRQAEVRMIEEIEKLAVNPQLHALAQRKPLRQVQIAPDEIGPAERIPPQVADLAVRRNVAPGAGAGTRIHR